MKGASTRVLARRRFYGIELRCGAARIHLGFRANHANPHHIDCGNLPQAKRLAF
jgi:hypothetical protein